jgi:hypothetical protein
MIGLEWTRELVAEKRQNQYHWISPTRKIEFRRRSQACEFEMLMKKFGSSEVRAWEEYRRAKAGSHPRQ